MKKRYWLAILCAALALVFSVLLPFAMHTATADGETSGQCGDDLYWSFDEETGTLTITGSGEMSNYSSFSNQPWTSFRDKITEIKIQDGVTSIGDHAFGNCTKLERVTIGNSVIIIGDYAFLDCTGLTEITIPDSVTSIGFSAFYRCSGLTEITIGDGIKSIGGDAFSSTRWLNAQSDGLVYLDYVLLCIKGTYGQIIRIKAGTRLIADYAFYKKTQITEVTIPDSVISIGDEAFDTCTGLQSITIPDSVTHIGQLAFYNCTGLQSITILGSVTSIPEYAFWGCTGLQSITIPGSVTSIGQFAFYNCTGLTSVAIPDTLIYIRDHAFSNCNRLTDVYYNGTLQMRDSITVLTGNTNLTNATWHFLTYVSFEVKKLPNKLSYQEGEPFDVTGGVIAVYYDYDIIWYKALTAEMVSGFDNTIVGTSTLTITFEGQTTTFDVTVTHAPGESVHENEVFPTCTESGHYDEVIYCSVCGEELSRDTITVSALGHDFVHHDAQDPTCMEIGWEAYDTCSRCDYTTYEEVPALGHAPGEPVIENEIDPTNTKEGSYEEVVYCTRCGAELERHMHTIDRLLFGDGLWWTFVNGKLTIGGSGSMPVFSPDSDQPWSSLCSEITEVKILNGVTSIGRYAFYGCTELTEITIPDGVTSIGYGAFHNCRGLQSITIPDSVTSVGGWAFNDTGWWKTQNDGLVYLDYILLGIKSSCSQIIQIKDGTRVIADYAFSAERDHITKVTIPDSVTSIGDDAFSYCTRLMEITIGNGVTSIGSYAFKDCTGLSEITIPDSVTRIGKWAFSGCTGLTEITIPDSVTSIEYAAFGDCTGLTSATIGNGVTSMGSYAFNNCTSLTEITISNGVTSIGSGAFKNCTALTEIMIPDSVTSIGEYTFEGCAGLSEITIPDSITSIGVQAFSKCTALQSITIGNGMTSIGRAAFFDCTNLKDVYYNGTRSDRADKLTINGGNDYLLNAMWHYLGESVDGIVEWNAADVKYKGTTPYVIANGSAQTPRFTVKNTADGSVVDPANYDYEYRENTNAGTGYVIVTFKGDYEGTCRGFFKIYLPPTTTTTVENVSNGIKLTWSPVEGAAGYVIYRRAWSSTTNGWTTFERWNNTTGTTYIDGADANHKVYAGTRYQYGIKAYFARRTDPVTGATIGGNVGDNFNLGEVGPLKTTVRITTRTLNSVTAGTKQMTVKWGASSVFTGYQIKYATDANFTKNVKAIKISDPKTAQTVISGLTSGTTYYVTVRSYHEFNGMTYFGEWSNVLSCKVK